MTLQLPKMDIPNRVERGRNPYEGYQRGWGLQFGRLFEALKKDEVFVRAGRLAQARSVVSPMHLANIYLIIRFFLGRLASQDIIEFGSFRGGSAFFMARCLKEFFPDARVYALDTFDGMPDTAAIDWHKRGDFSGADVRDVRSAAKMEGLDNLKFEKGLFQATFPIVASNVAAFGLAHIDCDIFASVHYCQNAVWPKMCKGGYLVFDDALMASCLGAMEAVEDFIIAHGLHSEQAFPHLVFRAGLQVT
jgi:predicted O-methyltransferase YrrM